MIKKLLFTSIILSFFFFRMQAQDAFNSGGGDVATSEASVSYSIGQVFYEPFSTFGGTLKVSPGVQQTYDIMDVTHLDDVLATVSVKLYPNPTSDFLEMQINADDLSGYSVALYDFSGKALSSAPVAGETTLVKMQQLPAGTYLLHLLKENAPVKIFKVIKN